MKKQWIEQILDDVDDQYIAEVIEAESNPVKKRNIRWKNCAAAVVISLAILGSGISVWAAVSDTFRNWIEKTFAGYEITEIEDVQEAEAADLPWDRNAHYSLAENMIIYGEKESFVCQYHMEGIYIEVDQVYSVQNEGLKKLEIQTFQGCYDEEDFSFSYAVINHEIFAFNISGACDQVFHYVDKGEVYAMLSQTEGDTIVKGCIARLDLRSGSMTKLTNDRTWGNMIMSPNGKWLLINDWVEYYWTALNLADGTTKRVDEINGYAHTNEIIFKGEDLVLSFGDTYMEGDVEMTGTKVVDLRTGEVVDSYKTCGEFGMEWICRTENGKLEMKNVDGTTAVSIAVEPGMGGGQHPLSIRGDYVLLGDLNHPDEPYYICNLEKGTNLRLDMNVELKGNVELYFAANEGKMLLTDGKEIYLINIEGM